LNECLAAHRETFGKTDDLAVGLQLTHSGRQARPHAQDRPEPLTAYAHPFLDRRFPGGVRQLADGELDLLVEDFVRAACRAQKAGYQFVDVKHCHGYLAHELLSARDREGRYGGSFENSTRFLREVVSGIRAEAPGLGVGVRVSVFDTVPYRRGADGVGVPEASAEGYRWAFGLLEGDAMDKALGPSPYWGMKKIWDTKANNHNGMFDRKGRVWFAATVRGQHTESAGVRWLDARTMAERRDAVHGSAFPGWRRRLDHSSHPNQHQRQRRDPAMPDLPI
jgi:2,4-dienoyl-CoA reductase-like NADH-dependent reductase (Old Yellow Enzyme family)